MQTATRTTAQRPWGLCRLAPYPNTVKMPFTTVTVDPDTQVGIFRDAEGQVVGKHGTSSATSTTTTTNLDSKNDQGSDQDSQQD
ncbi:putative ATP-grasp-modified RiPP [Streptomyces sp. bgisy027]|uniref:putative ATP-grasp-modified RiPP n=1 Tax=Streptomyces sp. bgisy027 TaxID=3413770 RepID=UPI003D7614D0